MLFTSRLSKLTKAPPENKMPSRLNDRLTDTWSRWVSQPKGLGHGWAFYLLDLPNRFVVARESQDSATTDPLISA